jgi:methyl-accepting chemotaxis protein
MLPALVAAKASTPETLAMDEQMDGLVDALDNPMQEFVGSLQAESVAGDKDFDTTRVEVTTVSVIVGIIGVLLAIVIGVALSRSITGPLIKGVAMLKEMSLGHLGARLKLERRDEVETVDQRAGILIVKLKRPDIRHSALAQNLIEEGFELMLFKEEEINLETAFMHLTKGITS